jgi:hypothetical protein
MKITAELLLCSDLIFKLQLNIITKVFDIQAKKLKDCIDNRNILKAYELGKKHSRCI